MVDGVGAGVDEEDETVGLLVQLVGTVIGLGVRGQTLDMTTGMVEMEAEVEEGTEAMEVMEVGAGVGMEAVDTVATEMMDTKVAEVEEDMEGEGEDTAAEEVDVVVTVGKIATVAVATAAAMTVEARLEVARVEALEEEAAMVAEVVTTTQVDMVAVVVAAVEEDMADMEADEAVNSHKSRCFLLS